MDIQSILSVTFGTMLNFDGHGDSDITCKQTLMDGILAYCKCTLPDIFIVP